MDMRSLVGIFLLVAPTVSIFAEEKPQDEFKIEVRIVEFKPIEGVTKPRSGLHLHIKPILTVTKADVVSVKKRVSRGPTIGSKETGFKHYPLRSVSVQLTEDAKLRVKAAVIKAQPTSTTTVPFLATVVNNKYYGSYTKYDLDDPTSLVHWSKFGIEIGYTVEQVDADKLIEFLTPSK